MQENDTTTENEIEQNSHAKYDLKKIFEFDRMGFKSERDDLGAILRDFATDIERHDLWHVRDCMLIVLDQIRTMTDDRENGIGLIDDYCYELQRLLVSTDNFFSDALSRSYISYLKYEPQNYDADRVTFRRGQIFAALASGMLVESIHTFKGMEVLDND